MATGSVSNQMTIDHGDVRLVSFSMLFVKQICQLSQSPILVVLSVDAHWA